MSAARKQKAVALVRLEEGCMDSGCVTRVGCLDSNRVVNGGCGTSLSAINRCLWRARWPKPANGMAA